MSGTLGTWQGDTTARAQAQQRQIAALLTEVQGVQSSLAQVQHMFSTRALRTPPKSVPDGARAADAQGIASDGQAAAAAPAPATDAAEPATAVAGAQAAELEDEMQTTRA